MNHDKSAAALQRQNGYWAAEWHVFVNSYQLFRRPLYWALFGAIALQVQQSSIFQGL